LEQPGCPNLYWALTNLPTPFVSLESGMNGERMFVDAELRDLDNNNPMSEEQLRKLIEHIDKIRDLSGAGSSKELGARAWLDARLKNEESVRAARRRLVDFGLSEERLLRFPADQVLLLDAKLEYEALRDDSMKFVHVPFWQAETLKVQVKTSKEPGL